MGVSQVVTGVSIQSTKTFEFEHIISLAVGGKTAFENLCFACPSCNRYKGDRQTAIDPDSGETGALFHPQEQVWEQHFVWSEIGSENIQIIAFLWN